MLQNQGEAMLGKTFSHYTIVEKLGEGGMGVVYLAEDTKLLRKVALKFLPENAVHEDDKARFLQEARAAAALNHPNVCTIHEIDEVEGHVFISMEYVPGQTLQELIDSGELDRDHAVDLVVQIASGLKLAHDAGVVHRYIKPVNIIITPEGQAKIMDFGLAKFMDLARMTKTHTTLGTAAYMSPEQVQGSTVDHRSDIWSLGVCLYQMVSGQLPFAGESGLALMYSIANQQPKALNEICEETPAALSSTVDLMLTKKVDERYQSCEQLLDDLGQSRVKPAPFSPARRRLIYAGAVCLILLGFLASKMLPSREPATWQDSAADMVAVLPFTYNGSAENEWLDEGMMDLLISTMDGLDGTRTVDAISVMGVVRQVGDPAMRIDGYEVASHLSVNRFLLGEIIEIDGTLRISAGLYDARDRQAQPIRGVADGEVADLFAVADNLAAQLLAGSQIEGDQSAVKAAITRTSLPTVKLYMEGLRLYRNNDRRGSKAAFTRVVEQDSLFALGWYALSWFSPSSSDARNAANRAFELSDDLPLRERLLIAGAQALIFGRHDEAEKHFKAVLRIYPQDIWALNSIAELYWTTNAFRGRSMYEAISYCNRIKELDPEAGPDFYLNWFALDMQDMEFLTENDFCGEGASSFCLLNTLAQTYDSSSESIMDEFKDTYDAIAQEEGVPEAPTTYPETPYLVVSRHVRHDWILKNFDWLRPNRAISLNLAHMLTDPSLIPLARQVGWWRMAYLSAARGGVQATHAYLDSLLTLDKSLQAVFPQGIPVIEMYSRAQLLVLPFLTVAPAAQDSMRTVLEQYDPASVPEYPGWTEDGNHGLIRLYLLGLLSCQLGDHAAALEYADQLHRQEPTEITGTSAVDLALGIRARVARNEGRTQEALGIMESAPRQVTFGKHAKSDFLEQSQERYFRGELLASLGQHDQALRWFESTRNFASLLFNTIRYYKMAQCHDALGHRAEAIENYRQFIRVWADCDPEQQPLVEDARTRLAQIESSG